MCFAALKPGLLFEPGRERAGSVEVVDIGIAAESNVAVLDPEDVWLPAPRRAGPQVVGAR